MVSITHGRASTIWVIFSNHDRLFDGMVLLTDKKQKGNHEFDYDPGTTEYF